MAVYSKIKFEILESVNILEMRLSFTKFKTVKPYD